MRDALVMVEDILFIAHVIFLYAHWLSQTMAMSIDLFSLSVQKTPFRMASSFIFIAGKLFVVLSNISNSLPGVSIKLDTVVPLLEDLPKCSYKTVFN